MLVHFFFSNCPVKGISTNVFIFFVTHEVLLTLQSNLRIPWWASHLHVLRIDQPRKSTLLRGCRILLNRLDLLQSKREFGSWRIIFAVSIACGLKSLLTTIVLIVTCQACDWEKEMSQWYTGSFFLLCRGWNSSWACFISHEGFTAEWSEQWLY